MNWKNALVRAVRTGLQGVAATLLAFYGSVKGDGTFVDIKAHGAVLAFGLFLTAVLIVLTFVQNLVEDNTGSNVPKG